MYGRKLELGEKKKQEFRVRCKYSQIPDYYFYVTDALCFKTFLILLFNITPIFYVFFF